MALGLSHRSRNERTFSAADLSIGVDIIGQEIYHSMDKQSQSYPDSIQINAKLSTDSILPAEVEFVSSMVSHSCLFNLRGCSTMAFLPQIISHGRAALESTTAAGLFVINGGLSLALLILLCPCAISIHVPYVSPIGSILYLLILLPILGVAISLSDTDSESMSRVPDKNDDSQVFTGRDEFQRLYKFALFRALPPAVLAQLTHLISFRELLHAFDSDFLKTHCPMSKIPWLTCDAVANYKGVASTSAGALMLAQMALCVVFGSIGFVHRTQSILKELPWINNQLWILGIFISLVLIILFLVGNLQKETLGALPWYFYICFLISPVLCVGFGEWIKSYDHKHEKRDVAFRRLKFETRLGMWSPK